MSDTPDELEQLDGIVQRHLRGQWHALPGKVVSFNAATLRASVKPSVKNPIIDENDERVVESLPTIPGVPVAFPPGYLATLAPGDNVLLVFCSASIDTWLTRGTEVDPFNKWRGSLSDAIAIPQLRVPTASAVGFEPVHKATTYDAAFDTLIDAIATAVGSITGGAAAGTAIETAAGVFQGARNAALTTIAKVK